MTTAPAFLQRMHAVFASERSNQFLLTGNIHDLVDASSLQPETEPFLPLSVFLRERLRSRGHVVLRYHIGYGIRASQADLRQLERAWPTPRLFSKQVARARTDPAEALALLEECTRLHLGGPVSVLIEHADLLFPAGEAGSLGDADRRRLAVMRDWLADARFMQHNGVLVLLTETAGGINARLSSMPTLTHIELPLPDLADRQSYLQHLSDTDLPPHIAELSAGMSLLDLRSLHREQAWQGRTIGRTEVLSEVNRLLRARIGEHLDIVEPSYDLDAVLGNRALKAELQRLTRLVDNGDPNLCPVGLLVAGPNGCGKTWIFSAWAASCQRVVVSLKNLRGSYFGETDRIFERVRQVLERLGQVIVLIDEADTQFAAPGKDSHSTEDRLFGHLIRLMGEPANRGQIIWVLLTARPERLAPDLKRSGRAGLHLPVFDPEDEDHLPFIARLLQALSLDWAQLDRAEQVDLQQRCEQLSAADYHEIGIRLQTELALGETAELPLLHRILADQRPSRQDPARLEQARQAVAHCSRRELLPASWRDD